VHDAERATKIRKLKLALLRVQLNFRDLATDFVQQRFGTKRQVAPQRAFIHFEDFNADSILKRST